MAKHPSESKTTQVHIIRGEHINGQGKLFGGKLMEWIDITAAVCARRHSGRNVTTAAVDHLHFRHPATLNDTLVMTATVTYTGRTSMEVRVDSFVEELNRSCRLINRAYLVMVALDDSSQPVPVPELLPQTPEEVAEYESAKQRTAERKARRQ